MTDEEYRSMDFDCNLAVKEAIESLIKFKYAPDISSIFYRFKNLYGDGVARKFGYQHIDLNITNENGEIENWRAGPKKTVFNCDLINHIMSNPLKFGNRPSVLPYYSDIEIPDWLKEFIEEYCDERIKFGRSCYDFNSFSACLIDKNSFEEFAEYILELIFFEGFCYLEKYFEIDIENKSKDNMIDFSVYNLNFDKVKELP